ncbi:MAG: hypothetical protein Q9167_005122 [Letrouitia subvulpina]
MALEPTYSGAGRSRGRTSWTSQAELVDYSTFIGFFYYFLTELYPSTHEEPRQGAENQSSSRPSVITARAPFAKSSVIPLIIAGYSYGALIAISLPPISTVLAQLTFAVKGTIEAELRLRALDLANQYKRDVQLYEIVQQSHLQDNNIPLNSLDLSAPEEIGAGASSRNEEASNGITEDDQTHRSTKKSVRWTQEAEERVEKPSLADLQVLKVTDLPTPVTYYLLISPLVPPVSTFVTMGKRLYRNQSHIVHKLLYNTSVVILGSKDFFTSEKNFVKWCGKIRLDRGDKEGLQKLGYEYVEGAGHFWKEEGKEDLLMQVVREFVLVRVESSGTKGAGTAAGTAAGSAAERTAAWATAVAEETLENRPTSLETVAEERTKEAAATASALH